MSAQSKVQGTRLELPVVAIIGRPNVGKSTFFNRMLGRRKALAHNRPGVTRDRHYGEAEYLGNWFVLIDTGGFEPDAQEDDVFLQVRNQAQVAIDEADVVLAFFDGRQGIVAGDYEIVQMLRAYDKPTLFVVNKVDGPAQDGDVFDFYQLGVDPIYPISSEHVRGTDDLLDALLELLPRRINLDAIEPGDESEEGQDPGDVALTEFDSHRMVTNRHCRRRRGEQTETRIALVGRPNVGKSSLANRILGSERLVIHPEAGTTRDSVDIPFRVEGQDFVLTDTAGVRRKARITDKLEQFTVIKAFKAISGSDIALLLIDASEGVTVQEQRLAAMIEEKGRAVAVIVNKWDLLEGKGAEKNEFKERMFDSLEFIRYAPVHFVSAMTGRGVEGILPLVARISKEHAREIPTAEFNTFLGEVTSAHSPPIYKNRAVKIYYGTQVNIRPPTFMLVANNPTGIRPDYRRYLVNQLRKRYGFDGSPVHLVIRSKKR